MRGLLDGAGRATGIDFRDCEYFVGTSAGSIVAAFLAAGREPDSGAEARAAKEWGSRPARPTARPRGCPWARPRDADGGPRLRARPDRRTAAAPFAPLALAGTAPGGAVARAAALAAVPRGKRSLGGLARLVEQSARASTGGCGSPRSTARSGKRVVFGAPGAPDASVAQAVLASCSIPWVFKPVTIGGREYVDGGVWSPTNLDATPARRGIEVLCLNPTAAIAAAQLGLQRRGAGGVARAAGARRARAHAPPRRRRRRGDGPQPDGPQPRARGARGRLRAGPRAGGMSHQDVNRGYWADQAPGYAETARRDWAAAEPELGHLEDPRGRRRRAPGRGRARRDRARLRHRLLLRLARPPRRAAGRDRPVARAARHRPRHAGRARPRVPAHRGRRRGGPAPRRELRLRPLRVRREPVVRARPLDRARPRGCCGRAGGSSSSPTRRCWSCCSAPDALVATDRLARPQFGLHRVEWDDEEGHSIEFHLPHGEMLRVLRDHGFEVEALHELRAPAGATQPLRVRHARVGAAVAVRGDLGGAAGIAATRASYRSVWTSTRSKPASTSSRRAATS